MTVFKGFLTITKRNLHMVFLYLGIFLAIEIMATSTYSSSESTGFQAKKLVVGVVDHDGGLLADALSEYLGNFHTIKSLPDDKAKLQDALFNRNVYYIVTIPKDFKESCLENGTALSTSKVPGSSDGYYIDQQINTFLNQARTLTASGYSDEEVADYILDHAKTTSHVTMLQSDISEDAPLYGYMFQYLPYVLLSICCYIMSAIMIAFHKPDLKRRILCSSVSIQSQNRQLALGYLTVGLAFWIVTTWLPTALMYGKSFFGSTNMPYYMLNSLMLLFVGLSLSFLLGVFIKKEELLSAFVNVITLGMSFLCGVFVPLDIMGKGVKTLAHFLPIYWYEISNNLLNHSTFLTQTQQQILCRNFGIQFLFAVAIFTVAMVVSKHKRQTAE